MNDNLFFDVFIRNAEISISVCELLENFEKKEIEKNLNEIYLLIEKEKTNEKKYIDLLERAFITPVDRDLLLEMCVKFTGFTERVRDIAASLYYMEIYHKSSEDEAFYALLKKMCEKQLMLAKELGNYKNSGKLKQIIEEIRKTETEGESMYVRLMKKLFSEEKDTKMVVCRQKINALYLKALNSGGNIARQTEKLILGK